MGLSHSKKLKFHPVSVGVVSRDMYRLSMESCACYQIIGLRSIYICLCEHI